MRGQIARLGREPPAFGLIHADLHVGNIFFDPKDGYHILDFDQCGYGWRAYDLATFIRSIAQTVTPSSASEIQRAFLEGYESLRVLEAAETEAIPAFMKAWKLWDIGETLALSTLWGGHRDDLTGKDDKGDYLREARRELERMISH